MSEGSTQDGCRMALSFCCKDEINTDIRIPDPMQKLIGKCKTSGIQLPPNLYATTHDTSIHREPPNINLMWQD
jgi:hypothetical protein